MKKVRIDKSKLEAPNIEISDFALSQIKLFKDNEHLGTDKEFRIAISGKGCDGFDYSCYFSPLQEDDFILELSNRCLVYIDPFSATYLKNVSIDFVFDHENNSEGFVIKNPDQKNYNGKFWKKTDEFNPPTL
ncbi:iron-sulfur cluster assembly accessory protein [bacterium]|nr:iron-sulfur cluster assembly accessory protein [bacterium]